jgi:clan AA aspartic protease (TIGR02281 family)
MAGETEPSLDLKADQRARLITGSGRESHFWMILISVIFMMLFFTGIGYIGVEMFRGEPPALPQANVKAPPPGPSRFLAVYEALRIAPLDASLETDINLRRALANLQLEKCDKSAIYAAAQALAKEQQQRVAATMLEGFSAECSNGLEELRAAADFYYQVSDNQKALSLTTALVRDHPDRDDFWYIHAKIQAALRMYDDALVSFTKTISLHHPQAALGEWVFTEMAETYAALHRYCDAMQPIVNWASLDPPSRSNPRTDALIENYRRLGNCRPDASGGETFRTSGGTVRIRAEINGTPGTFIVDTGASVVYVDEKFAKKAGLAFEDSKAGTTLTANGNVEVKFATSQSVKAGRAEADHVLISVGKHSVGDGIDGLLGMSFLSRFEVAIRPGAIQISSRATKNN